jgi:hypothetical protein
MFCFSIFFSLSRYYGIQHQALANLATHGVAAISRPSELFRECQAAGLIDRFLDVAGSEDRMRELLLDLSMTYDLLSVIQVRPT